MTGRREQICARLFEIGKGVHNWKRSLRNSDNITPNSLPLFGLWDGDQNVVETQNRMTPRAMAPVLVEITPTLAIAVPGTVDSIGEEANELHDAMIYAVLSDTQLYTLIANREVYYLGTAMAQMAGTKQLAVTININFALRYHLAPASLAPSTD